MGVFVVRGAGLAAAGLGAAGFVVVGFVVVNRVVDVGLAVVDLAAPVLSAVVLVGEGFASVFESGILFSADFVRGVLAKVLDVGVLRVVS